jgi:peptidoglycan/LPS O-acetylase OafA/YrhL
MNGQLHNEAITTATPRYRGLDGYRFIAASLIVLYPLQRRL